MSEEVLAACPFCGHTPRPDNFIDSIYPVSREDSLWRVACLYSEGGCTASVLGSSREDAIARWNKRYASKVNASVDYAFELAMHNGIEMVYDTASDSAIVRAYKDGDLDPYLSITEKRMQHEDRRKVMARAVLKILEKRNGLVD